MTFRKVFRGIIQNYWPIIEHMIAINKLSNTKYVFRCRINCSILRLIRSSERENDRLIIEPDSRYHLLRCEMNCLIDAQLELRTINCLVLRLISKKETIGNSSYHFRDDTIQWTKFTIKYHIFRYKTNWLFYTSIYFTKRELISWIRLSNELASHHWTWTEWYSQNSNKITIKQK